MASRRRTNTRSKFWLDLAQTELEEALRVAGEAVWTQSPALVEIIGPRSRKDCAKILTPLIHHHYEELKMISAEARREIYEDLSCMLKHAVVDLTDEQIAQLLAKPSETFYSPTTKPPEGPEIKRLEEEVRALTWEYHQYVLATFEPSPTLLEIAGHRTARQYLGILQTVSAFE
jgi:hypothetical protein